MKTIIYFLLASISCQFVSAQVTYKNFNSVKLNEARELKIQLPRSYKTSDKSYPIILVLDGDHMFEIVASNFDYTAYWGDIPEAIVVGVNQYNKRDADNLYSEQSGLPTQTGAAFYKFISDELIPFIEKTYRTETFKLAIGHGATANFINYYLLQEAPLFNAYIAISPDLAPNMIDLLTEKLPKIENKTFYHLATSNNDFESVQKTTRDLNAAIIKVNNENILNSFDDFNEPSHYTLPAHVIPKALEKIFSIFKPISSEEYRNTILKLETPPVDYLIEKYKTIEDLFGIKKPVLINDFKAIAAAIKKTEQFEDFEPLGMLAREHYPHTLLGNYYLGRFYEETGVPKKAMKTYQSAYILEEIAGITKDHVLKLSEQIKEDFGY